MKTIGGRTGPERHIQRTRFKQGLLRSASWTPKLGSVVRKTSLGLKAWRRQMILGNSSNLACFVGYLLSVYIQLMSELLKDACPGCNSVQR